MPRYDFKCSNCGITFEAITPSTCTVMHCVCCEPVIMMDGRIQEYAAQRQLCKPASIHIH
jgi:hypothetical protein